MYARLTATYSLSTKLSTLLFSKFAENRGRGRGRITGGTDRSANDPVYVDGSLVAFLASRNASRVGESTSPFFSPPISRRYAERRELAFPAREASVSRIVPRDFSFRAEFPPVNRALPSKFPDFIDTLKETATRRIGDRLCESCFAKEKPPRFTSPNLSRSKVFRLDFWKTRTNVLEETGRDSFIETNSRRKNVEGQSLVRKRCTRIHERFAFQAVRKISSFVEG